MLVGEKLKKTLFPLIVILGTLIKFPLKFSYNVELGGLAAKQLLSIITS